MCSTLKRSGLFLTKISNFSSSSRYSHHSCKVLVVGGGTAGCTMAAKLSKKFDKDPNHVIVIEPSEVHYYQPLFTLVGGGIKNVTEAQKPMQAVLPPKANWIKDKVVSFEPNENRVTTAEGDVVHYEHLIVAMGLELYWHSLPGLLESIQDAKSHVCSIYGPNTVSKVFDVIKNTKKGNAIFTFPNTGVKCPGAPQKILYLAEDYWSKQKRRSKINVTYNTSLPVIFGVKKYADALWGVCNKRDINVKLRSNLIEIKPDIKEAVFQDLDKPEKKFSIKYSMLHVTPPMGPPEVLKKHSELTNEAGYLDVNPQTLQHKKFNNIFGLGDCTNTPNSKTMAAIASQSKVLYENIISEISGKQTAYEYDGYASCPLITGPGKCILAEFNYKLQPQETFPFDQAKEMYSMYMLKKEFFPFLYWNSMLKGNWDGPAKFRKMFNSITKKDPAV